MTNTLIITGGSRGIGHAAIERFLKENWQVINVSRSTCELDGVTNIAIDLSSAEWQATDTLLSALQSPKKICLIHNASRPDRNSIQTLSAEQMRENFELNVVAPLRLNQLILPLMNFGSSIIYVGTTLSEMAVPNTAPYTIAKHAQLGLMRSTCQDLDNTGIHTCCICPGMTDTAMLREYLKETPELFSQLKENFSFKRLVKPEEIAELMWFCSQNPVINGSVLHGNLGVINH